MVTSKTQRRTQAERLAATRRKIPRAARDIPRPDLLHRHHDDADRRARRRRRPDRVLRLPHQGRVAYQGLRGRRALGPPPHTPRRDPTGTQYASTSRDGRQAIATFVSGSGRDPAPDRSPRGRRPDGEPRRALLQNSPRARRAAACAGIPEVRGQPRCSGGSRAKTPSWRGNWTSCSGFGDCRWHDSVFTSMWQRRAHRPSENSSHHYPGATEAQVHHFKPEADDPLHKLDRAACASAVARAGLSCRDLRSFCSYQMLRVAGSGVAGEV